MDFSWVKQLADQANQQEISKQEEERKAKETRKKVAQATCPFVEKLFLLINTCSEEFNKHCMFQHLRVSGSKLYKRSRTGPESTAEPDEVAYFTISRGSYMYGIRGMNGLVEFVEMPISEGSGIIAIKLDELGITASKTFVADLDLNSNEVIWKMDERPLNGPLIVSQCQQYFSDFIAKSTH